LIKLIDKLPDIKNKNAAYAKICCHFAAYKEFSNIALFWAQFDNDNKPRALFSMIDSVMMLCYDGGDIEEITEFLRAVGPKKIFTDAKTASNLNLNVEVDCATLYRDPPFSDDNAVENTYTGLDALYNTLSKGLNIGNREAFIADISHRIRHNAATYVSSPFSAAAIIFDEKFAVINGIAVLPEKSGLGLGSATLNRLLSGMKNRRVFVCAEQKNIPFYLKNGFAFYEDAAYTNTNGVF